MKSKTFIIIGLTFLLLAFSVSAAWTYLPPVHYYKFDNTLTDENTSKTINFTISAGSGSYKNGRLNQGLNLTNSRYASITTYELSENITTIALWFNYTSSNSAVDQFLFSIQDTAANYLPDSLYCGVNTANKVYCGRFMNGGGAPVYEITGSTTLTNNTWYHFILVMGVGGTQVYINGTLQANSVYATVFNSDNAYLYVGRRYDAANYFNGTVDNLALFGYRFNDSHFNASYNLGEGVEYIAGAPPPVASSLNLSTPQPYNDTGFYTNPVRFNMSVNSSENFGCILFINGGDMASSYYGLTPYSRYLWRLIDNATTTSSQTVNGGDWTNFSNILDGLNNTFSTPKYSTKNYGYIYLNYSDVAFYNNNELVIKVGSSEDTVTFPLACIINNSWGYLKVEAFVGGGYWLNISCLNNTNGYLLLKNYNDPVLDTVTNFYSIDIYSRNSTHNNSYLKGSNVFVEELVYFPLDYESQVNYSWNCSNGVDNVNTSNTSILIDLVSPNIYTTFSSNNSFGFNWMKGQVNFSDPNLFGYNFSVDNVLWFNTTGISSSFYQLNISHNVSNLSGGYHNVTMCVFDGHTDKNIGLFSTSKDEVKKELKYLFDNGDVSIYPELSGDYSDFSSDKLVDKYTFTYTSVKKGKKDVVFYIKSSSYIYIPKKSDYKGHVIIPGLSKWVDFETAGNYETLVERVNDNTVKVTIYGIDKDVIKFSSIGSLNVLCRTYVFDRINITDVSFSSFTEKSTGVFNLSMTYAGSYSINITLNYNNTNYQVSTSDGHRYNVSVPVDASSIYTDTSKVYYWNYTFNNTISRTNTSLVYNTTVYMMWFGSCGGISNNTAFNFSFFDENNISLETTARMSGLVQVFKTSVYNRNYSIILSTEKHDQLLCLFPWYETYNVTGYLDYVNLTSTTRRYVVNGTVSNVSRAVTLYLAANESAIPVVMTVIDKDGFPIGGVQVKIDRYYPTTGLYLEVDSLTTDFQGQVRMLMTLYTVEYRFRFEYPLGTIISSTAKAYIISQSLTYQLTIGDEYFQPLTQSVNVTGNLTWSNASESFIFDYIDVSNQVLYGCLHVYKVTDQGKISQNSSCLAWTNGRINISFTPDNNTQYDAEGYVCYTDRCDLIASGSGYRFVIPSSFGKSGLLLVLLLTIVIACGVIFNASLTALLLPVPLCIGVFMGFVNLPPFVTIMIFLFGVTIAIIINLRSSP